MFQEIVDSSAPDEESRRAYTSLMIRVIRERDIGACEICHLLHGIPLYQCTRTFRVLVITIEDYVAINGTNSENDSNSFIQFYSSRPLDMEEITLFDFAKKISKGRNNSISTNRKERIVQVFPKVNNNNNAVNTELYCKQKFICTGAKSVSYTHLDVYKRQPVHTPLKTTVSYEEQHDSRPTPCVLSLCHFALVPKMKGRYFGTVEGIKKETQAVLDDERRRNCF